MAGPIRVGIAGALGRMGHAVAAAVDARADAQICAVYDRPGSEGQLAEHEGARERVLVTRDQALAGCQVIIDFTTPEATAHLAEAAAERGGPALVLGSTGLSEAQEALIAKAAAKVPVVRSRSFALGVNMLIGLVEEAARRLPKDWDIEVFEAHHRRKVDAPSGTALMLGEWAAKGRGAPMTAERGRDGITGPRQDGAIGFSVMRGGDIIGDHSVSFIAEDEILTLSHSARNRSLFARGAVEAAIWVAGRPPGLYSLLDVLGFE